MAKAKRLKDSPIKVDNKEQHLDRDGTGNSISAVLSSDAAEQQRLSAIVAERGSAVDILKLFAIASGSSGFLTAGSAGGDEAQSSSSPPLEAYVAQLTALEKQETNSTEQRVISLENEVRVLMDENAALKRQFEQQQVQITLGAGRLASMEKSRSAPPPPQPSSEQHSKPGPEPSVSPQEGSTQNTALLMEAIGKLMGIVQKLVTTMEQQQQHQQQQRQPQQQETPLPPPPTQGPRGRSKSKGPSTTWAGRAGATAGRKPKGATPPPAPAPQEKPPIPDLAASPTLTSSFILSGAASLQGIPQDTLPTKVQQLVRQQLGVEVKVMDAWPIGRQRPDKPQLISFRVRNPAEGQLVRHSRCKLAGVGVVILDALTRAELSWHRRLRGSFKDAQKLSQNPQFQRARLFITKQLDGRVERCEVFPPPQEATRLG